MTQCPWKIHWGIGQESTTQCAKPEHLTGQTVTAADAQHRSRGDQPGENVFAFEGDPGHEGRAANGITMISWQAGDRREYTGDWPGPCLLPGGGGRPCTLHAGHNGRCAP